jgi:hypothetical protein
MQDTVKFRKMVIEMVLATDFKQHIGIMTQFKTGHRLQDPASSPSAAAAPGAAKAISRAPSVG